jgi:hypothetical protein
MLRWLSAEAARASRRKLYGTTYSGGANNDGTIFSFVVPMPVTPPPYFCSTQPTVTSIDSASAYGGYFYFASGSWLEINGTNLMNPADPRLTAATNPGQWTSADFNGVRRRRCSTISA